MAVELFHTNYGALLVGNSLEVLRALRPSSISLVVTSPPYLLSPSVQRDYAAPVNEAAYLTWLKPFAEAIKTALHPDGSFVLNIAGAWNKGVPTRSLFHAKLLLLLVEDIGFHLAQEMYWWNPSKMPAPAEWTNIRRIRLKDAVEHIWWLSPTPWPKADNRRVLAPYSKSMKRALKTKRNFKDGASPSGHHALHPDQPMADLGGSIAPNLLAVPNAASNDGYLRYCKEKGLKPHPARFPTDLPGFFIRLLTDPDDVVIDPFAGSATTGEAAERLKRRWLCIELDEKYAQGAKGRFDAPQTSKKISTTYELAHPNAFRDIADRPMKIGNGQTRTPPPLEKNDG